MAHLGLASERDPIAHLWTLPPGPSSSPFLPHIQAIARRPSRGEPSPTAWHWDLGWPIFFSFLPAQIKNALFSRVDCRSAAGPCAATARESCEPARSVKQRTVKARHSFGIVRVLPSALKKRLQRLPPCKHRTRRGGDRDQNLPRGVPSAKYTTKRNRDESPPPDDISFPRTCPLAPSPTACRPGPNPQGRPAVKSPQPVFATRGRLKRNGPQRARARPVPPHAGRSVHPAACETPNHPPCLRPVAM